MYPGICLGDVPVIERSVFKTANHHTHSKRKKKKEKKEEEKKELYLETWCFSCLNGISYGNAHSKPGFPAFFLFLKC